MRIQIDVDGVLANFVRGYLAQYERVHGWPLAITEHEAMWDDLHDSKTWTSIRQSNWFWGNLDPLCPRETFDRLAVLGADHDVYYVTARPGVNVAGQTRLWLARHGVPSATVILSGRKGEMAAALDANFAIDDKAGNAIFISYHSPRTETYIVNRQYNQFDHAVLGRRVIRVPGIEEFVSDIERSAA